ncbi:MAG: pilin [Patescibacteria group bacterium]|jgi:hypothetical protein
MAECSSLCNERKLTPIGCFAAGQPLPDNDGKCWTEKECAEYATDRNGAPKPGTWAGQNINCTETKNREARGYCFAPATGVNLNVPILGRTTVLGFHEYLALAYQFLLPAMSLIAVVMIMVGGLEYVVAGGNSKRLDKAKTRISNALIGLVLLLSAYAIASLLDPRLVNLIALRTPLIKRIILIDPNASCEYLEDNGFDINASAEKVCGKEGVIQSIDNVKLEVKNTNWKVGDKCQYSHCFDGGACMGSGSKMSCILCPNINTITATEGLTPSDASCSAALKVADTSDKDDNHKYFCSFDDGGYLGTSVCVSAFTPGSLNPTYIDCKTVQSDVTAENPCSAYDKVNIYRPKADLLSYNAVAISSVESYDYSHAAKVCETDPCGVAKAIGKKCGFYVPSGIASAVDYVPVYGTIVNFITGITNNQCLTEG